MTGVSYEKSRNKWTARATVNKRRVLVGRFDTEDEAELALGLFNGKLNAAQIDADFDREFEKFAKKSMQLEETKSRSIFTRLKGFRLRRHKL